jgi:acyl-CoA thioesterase II
VDRLVVTLRQYLGLRPTDDPARWHLDLAPRVLTPAGAMHGGAALATVVEALEGTVGRPLIWATAHYLSHAGPTGTLDVDVTIEVAGNRTTQARATLALGDTEVLTAAASLGGRDFPFEGRWIEPPDVPGPHDAPCRPLVPPPTESVVHHYEVRFADGRTTDQLDGTRGPGRSAVWCRLPAGRSSVGAGDVALVGDLVVLGLSDAIGVPSTANSLDNTIRIVESAESEWVLVDIKVDAVARGYAHAGAALWTEHGTLLGLASQTLVLRPTKPDGMSARTTRRIVGGT